MEGTACGNELSSKTIFSRLIAETSSMPSGIVAQLAGRWTGMSRLKNVLLVWRTCGRSFRGQSRENTRTRSHRCWWRQAWRLPFRAGLAGRPRLDHRVRYRVCGTIAPRVRLARTVASATDAIGRHFRSRKPVRHGRPGILRHDGLSCFLLSEADPMYRRGAPFALRSCLSASYAPSFGLLQS